MGQRERQHLKVLVADERQKYLEPVSTAVRDLGHEVIAHEVSIAKVGRATLEHRPDIAIVALHEDTHHALELISEIVDEAVCPVIALADDASRDFVAGAANRGVFAYIDSTNETELQGRSTSRSSATTSSATCSAPSSGGRESSAPRASSWSATRSATARRSSASGAPRATRGAR